MTSYSPASGTRKRSRGASRVVVVLTTGLLVVGGSLLGAAPALADSVTKDGIHFETDTVAGTAEVTGFDVAVTGTDIVIPDSIEDGGVAYPVVEIGGSIFLNSGLTSVVTPSIITTSHR